MSPEQPSKQPSERPTREERQHVLSLMAKPRLVTIHRAGAGCLMSRDELMQWSRDELVAAILEAEYGPRPITVEDL